MVYKPMNVAIPPMALADTADQNGAPSVEIDTAATADPHSFDSGTGDTGATDVGGSSSVATQPPSYLSNIPGTSFPDTQQPNSFWEDGGGGVQLGEGEDGNRGWEGEEEDGDGEIHPARGSQRRRWRRWQQQQQQQQSRPWWRVGKVRT